MVNPDLIKSRNSLESPRSASAEPTLLPYGPV